MGPQLWATVLFTYTEFLQPRAVSARQEILHKVSIISKMTRDCRRQFCCLQDKDSSQVQDPDPDRGRQAGDTTFLGRECSHEQEAVIVGSILSLNLNIPTALGYTV